MRTEKDSMGEMAVPDWALFGASTQRAVLNFPISGHPLPDGFIRGLGLPYSELEKRGTQLAVAEATIRYHAPARYDNLVRVETRLTEVRSRAITFDYVIRNAESGERLATARTLLVSLDPSGKPVPMPAEVRALMERGIARP